MLARLLTTLDARDDGYGNAIAAEGEDIAANVRAHRRVFERLGFFAEDEDGAQWAFDLAANREEPPVVALDTEGRYAWLGTDLAQVLAAPSRERATWLRYEDDAVSLHFEVERDAVSRITLMTAPRGM